MRVFFVLLILALPLALGLAALIEEDSGYVLIAYHSAMVEMSIWVALILEVLLLLSLFLIFWLLFHIFSPGGHLLGWFSSRGDKKIQRQTYAGLLAYAEGDWSAARKALVKSAPKATFPHLNYLLAARACQALGDNQTSEEYLRKASDADDSGSVAISLTQAELQLAAGHLEQCLVTLNRLRQARPKHTQVLRLLVEVYRGLKDWQSVIALLPELKKSRIYAEAQMIALEKEAYGQRLREQLAGAHKTSMDVLSAAWHKFPKAVRTDPEIICSYVASLVEVDAQSEAEKVLRQALKQSWDNRLVEWYGQVRGEHPERQLLLAESWLQSRPNNDVLLLCLGRLALLNQLWGKAREYYQMSITLHKTAEACAELGRLLAYLGEHEKSTELFQQGLLLSSKHLIDWPMPGKEKPGKELPARVKPGKESAGV